ncbi:MAG: metalloregulator ArsR/SmtB family transcription factor [Desulfobacterales bacterium]|nr:metalloregulator ArsR/SmtB family transcription factor [Desulfobacterales bacterium]
MRHLVRTTKALADESRIRILGALRENELCVCQLIELLGLAPSTVSKHLSILRNARLIDSRKQGRWMYYRVAGADAPEQIAHALKWVFGALEQTDQQAKDRLRLEEILKIDPEVLCSRQPNSDNGDPERTQG